MKAAIAVLSACWIGYAIIGPVCAVEGAKAKENAVYSFGSTAGDGVNPEASLIEVKGTFYGTTYGGGTHGFGTVFALDQKTGAEKVLYSFCAQQNCADGSRPLASLTEAKGMLFGTTYEGGTANFGTVFVLNPTTGTETVLHSFCSEQNCVDGQFPASGLLDVKGTLYGTAENGGTYGSGVAFGISPDTGAEKVVYSFGSNDTDGANPAASLIDANGTFYGTTAYGGANGYGTVFALDRKTGAESVLYSFCAQQNCSDGKQPYASLIDVNGTLFGTTQIGGTYGFGTVFSLDMSTGVETTIYSFCSQQSCTDGANPKAGLIYLNGSLLGTTSYGGIHGDIYYGVVFAVVPSTGAEKVVYPFCSIENCMDGEEPLAGLTNVKGTLYGTTSQGGDYGEGIVFALKKP